MQPTSHRTRNLVLVAFLTCLSGPLVRGEHHERFCERNLEADVIALDHAFYNNRLGALQAGGQIFALRRDVVSSSTSKSCLEDSCRKGDVMLRPDKRPRPMVLRMNVGDCMTVEFQNLIGDTALLGGQTTTRYAGVHVMGMEPVSASMGGQALPPISADGSFVGANSSSLAAPGESITYKFYARAEGQYLLYSTADTRGPTGSPGGQPGAAPQLGGQLQQGLFGAVIVEPPTSEYYRSQVTKVDMDFATTSRAPTGHPVLDYQAIYPTGTHYSFPNEQNTIPDGTPVLNMLKKCAKGEGCDWEIVHTDLTALITGPRAGSYSWSTDSPSFFENPASPDRRQPYREFVTIYHDSFMSTQAFPEFRTISTDIGNVLAAGRDLFAINYGMAAIGPPIWANRIRVGPMYQCVTCRYEEFFLSAWPIADPAMVVDVPANSPCQPVPDAEGKYTVPDNCQIETGPKATKALFPDDPSNVYHSYIGDHTKFRLLHAASNITHVHHQHAHQWLHSANSDNSNYRDSQMISPGANYLLEMVYRGSGNVNQVVGDSIFHCHFYPHFAEGMWAMWRTHDVFEAGTELEKGSDAVKSCFEKDAATGKLKPIEGCWVRALPDGEIAAGTPIPAVVPIPTLPMASMPANVKVVPVCSPQTIQLPDKNKYAPNGVLAPLVPCPIDPAPGAVNGPLVGYRAQTEAGKTNPGFPFFIPGVAGQRAPHPPLDFAIQEEKPDGEKVYYDGGLPRSVAFQEKSECFFYLDPASFSECIGQIIASNEQNNTNKGFYYEKHNKWDFTKYNGSILAVELPQEGTGVEKIAMAAHAIRGHPSSMPKDGLPGTFTLNGQPPAPGAPFAEPAIDLDGTPVGGGPDKGNVRRYKGANIQLDVVFNKKGWHYPQQRILTLWGDVEDTLDGTRPAEPFFFRANTNDTIEYWHANLVPNYYQLDDFQVRTPTDILGQHIHLVKFDVTSSDGAANGFNYEDGTFSPIEVQEVIHDINEGGGLYDYDPNWFAGPATSQRDLEAKSIPFFGPGPPIHEPGSADPNATIPSWLGGQVTIQRWYADPLLNNKGHDRTIRTVFTHDHFGPSTHQQAGFYAGLLVEPQDSDWFTFVNGSYEKMGSRVATGFGANPVKTQDGGPTSWSADILTADHEDSYREFMLEFQDLSLAYGPYSPEWPRPYARYRSTDPPTRPDGLPTFGWADPQAAISPPAGNAAPSPKPHLISNLFTTGTQTVNYRNELPSFRLAQPSPGQTVDPQRTDLSHVYRSIERNDPDLNRQPDSKIPINPTKPLSDCTPSGSPYPVQKAFCFEDPFFGAVPTDPYTPLLRAYEGDKVQVRVLVGAHTAPHFFTMHGLKWQFEPAVENSGYRASQGMGISEHYEFLFDLPRTGGPNYQSDYLYQPSSAAITGITNGNWGILRAYKDKQEQLKPLPNNPDPYKLPEDTTSCPPGAPVRFLDVTATSAQKALGRPLIYNDRGQFVCTKKTAQSGDLTCKGTDENNKPFDGVLTNNGQILAGMGSLMYVHTDDLDQYGRLKKGTPEEPLVLRAAAGDCIRVTLRNSLSATDPPNTVVLLNPQFLEFTVPGTKTQVDQMAFFFDNRRYYDVQFREGFNKNRYGFSLPTVPAPPTEAFKKAIQVTQVIAGQAWTLSQTINGVEFSFNIARVSDTVMTVRGKQVLNPSREVGLHPQLVTYDVNDSDGINVGLNPVQTARPGESVEYTWYAGQVELEYEPGWKYQQYLVESGKQQIDQMVFFFDNRNYYSAEFRRLFNMNPYGYELPEDPVPNPPMTYQKVTAGKHWKINQRINGYTTQVYDVKYDGAYPGRLSVTTSTRRHSHKKYMPVEYGSINLIPSDALIQHRLGMIGSLIVEPEGSTWRTDSNSHASATVTKADGSRFREFVLMVQDDVLNMVLADRKTHAPTGTLPGGVGQVDVAVNYRTEPLIYRGVNPNSPSEPPAIGGIFRALSNSQVSADPETPIFAAGAGVPVRFRMLHPAGLNEQVAMLHGHSFQEEPYTEASTEIGFNPESQWFGARDSFGPNISFDMVLASAGGIAKVQGDYLYRSFIANDANWGLWGVMRVGAPGADVVAINLFKHQQGAVSVRGRNTVNTSTGQMARSVTVYAGPGGCAPDTSPGTRLGVATVDPMSGKWELWSSVVPPAGQQNQVTVISAGGGCRTSDPVDPTPATIVPLEYYPSEVDRFRPKTILRKDSEPN